MAVTILTGCEVLDELRNKILTTVSGVTQKISDIRAQVEKTRSAVQQKVDEVNKAVKEVQATADQVNKAVESIKKVTDATSTTASAPVETQTLSKTSAPQKSTSGGPSLAPTE